MLVCPSGGGKRGWGHGDETVRKLRHGVWGAVRGGMGSCGPSLSPPRQRPPVAHGPPGRPFCPPLMSGSRGASTSQNQPGGPQNVPVPAGLGISPELRAPSCPEQLPGGHGGSGSGGASAVPEGPGAVLGGSGAVLEGRGHPRAEESRRWEFLGRRCTEVSVPGDPGADAWERQCLGVAASRSAQGVSRAGVLVPRG